MYGWPVGSGNAKHLRNEKNPQKNEFTTKFPMWILNNRTAFDCDTEQHGSPMRTNSHRIRRRRGRCARWKKWEDENCVDCVCEFGMSATHTHRMSYYKIYTPIANRDSTTETLTLTLTLWRNNFVECAFFFFNSFVNIYSVFKANAHFKVTAVCLINETKTKKEI